jgi:hypothetical protein
MQAFLLRFPFSLPHKHHHWHRSCLYISGFGRDATALSHALCLAHPLCLAAVRLFPQIGLMLIVRSCSSFSEPGILLPLVSNSQRFGPVVDHRLLEPRMLESLLCGYPLLGIVDENLSQQIQQLLVERGGVGNEFLYMISAEIVHENWTACSHEGVSSP